MALMTTEQVGDYLAVSVRVVRELVKSGEIPAVRVGKEYRFDEADVTGFITRNRTT